MHNQHGKYWTMTRTLTRNINSNESFVLKFFRFTALIPINYHCSNNSTILSETFNSWRLTIIIFGVLFGVLGILVSKFKLQSLLRSLSEKYPRERHEPPYAPSYGSNSTTTVLLKGWLWYKITHPGWYAIKQRNKTTIIFFQISIVKSLVIHFT